MNQYFVAKKVKFLNGRCSTKSADPTSSYNIYKLVDKRNLEGVSEVYKAKISLSFSRPCSNSRDFRLKPPSS